MPKSRIVRLPNGDFAGVGFHSAETAALPERGVAIVLMTYATGLEHMQKITAGKAEPKTLQGYMGPETLRATAALFLRTADAVERKKPVKV